MLELGQIAGSRTEELPTTPEVTLDDNKPAISGFDSDSRVTTKGNPEVPVKTPMSKGLQQALIYAAELNRYEPAGKPWEGFRDFTIREVVDEADGQKSFILEPTDGEAIAGFKAGQYLTFLVEVNGEEHTRCYSLSDSQDPRHYRVTIKQAVPPRDAPSAPPGLVSSFFHDLKAGDVVKAAKPSGTFVFDLDEPTPAVMLGGGVGITPLMSMINEVARTGSEREVHLYYAVKKCSELVRPEELKALEARHPNIHVHLVVNNPGKNAIRGSDYDHTGRVGIDLLRETLPPQNYQFYMCGPPGMMAAITKAFGEYGIPARDIHTEAFAATTKSELSPREAASGISSERVVEAHFGQTLVKWHPDDETLLDAARAQNVKIQFGCKQGTCGVCACSLSSGEVSHPEGVVAEGKTVLPCVLRPESDELTFDV